MKSVRFSKVVSRSGAPELHSLWVPPAEDAAFQRALKSQRVMTLTQIRGGSHRDRGVVGYEPGEQAQFLIFPKSLKPFAGREVVGVKYELLGQPELARPYHAPAPRRKAPAAAEINVKIVDDPPPGRGEVKRRRARADEDNVVAFADARDHHRVKDGSAGGEAKSTHGPRGRAAQKVLRADKPANAVTERHLAALTTEVKRAVKELKQGKAVAAYERLTDALREAGAQTH